MRIKIFSAFVAFYIAVAPAVFADITINLVAVNGKDSPKTSSIRFDLPGELSAEDIVDTNGLQLDYDVDDANYFVFGDVAFKPKESKTFRILVKDKWMASPQMVADLKKQIDQGYDTLGVPYNAKNAQILKDRLYAKIDYIVGLQTTNAGSTEKRIDAYRQYTKDIKRIQNNALDVAYWRSDPAVEEASPKLIHLRIEVSNPTTVVKHFKHKDYLPGEVKPEDVVEAEGFEVRYDQVKQQSFLFKEEDLSPGVDKKYSIGIIDIWNIDQKSLDNLRARTAKAVDFLKGSKYEELAQILTDRISANLKGIEDSQAVARPILAHIGAYRINKLTYADVQKDVETLEKLLSVFRENLTKSKVENVLAKIQSLKGVADVSKVMFNKKFESTTAFSFTGWILMFVCLFTGVNFVIWLIRSKDKKLKDTTVPGATPPPSAPPGSTPPPQK